MYNRNNKKKKKKDRKIVVKTRTIIENKYREKNKLIRNILS